MGGHSIEVGDAVKKRPRDAVRKAAGRLARRIEREHRDWLVREFGSDPSGQAAMAGMFAALPDGLVDALTNLPAIADADLQLQEALALAVRQVLLERTT